MPATHVKIIHRGSVDILSGLGTPEGDPDTAARIGSLYLREDGGAGTALYSKESGTGNTGWVAGAGGGGLTAGAAGDGLAFNAGVISVNVDASTLEIDTDTLRVKAGGITAAHVAADVATQAELDASALLAPLKAPADAARNTIQPTGDVAALTLKSLNASPAANTLVQSWQRSNGTVFGAISDVGAANLGGVTRTKKHGFILSTTDLLSVGLHIQKAVGASSALDLFNEGVVAAQGGYNADGALLRFFDINSDRGTGSPGARGQEPATWIAQDGAIFTHKYMVISGTTAGALDTWQLQPPSNDNSMLALWCDTDGPTINSRAAPSANSWQYNALDTNGNYVFAIENNGKLQWGAGATRASMDVTLERDTSGWGGLATNKHLLLLNNKRILAKNLAGTYESLFYFDNGDVLTIAAPDTSIVRTQAYGPFRVLQKGTPYAIFFDITATQIQHNIDTLIAEAKNIVLGTTTGTKIGTGATQKLGFWNATPVVQPAAYTQTYATATRTNANPTAVTLTDSTGGTANTTLEALTGAIYTTDVVGIRNNFADLAAAVNALIVDLANAKQVLNSLVDDHQSVGLCA